MYNYYLREKDKQAQWVLILVFLASSSDAGHWLFAVYCTVLGRNVLGNCKTIQTRLYVYSYKHGKIIMYTGVHLFD